MTNELQLFMSDRHGIYIPQFFANDVNQEFLTGVDKEDMQILKSGPEHEYYWDAWDCVLDSAVLTDSQGNVFTLYQDGDLWIVPYGYEWDYMY